MRLGLRLLAHRWARTSALALVAAAIGVGCAGSVEDRLTEVRALQDAGQFNESIEPLRQILARDPELGEANYLLGVALVQTGQASLAVWPLEKAAGTQDHAVPAGLLLASTFLTLDAYDDAIRVASKVLESKPDNLNALRIRTQAKLGNNQRTLALEDAVRLRQLAPDDFQAALMRATILAELGRIDEAEKAHEELEQMTAKNPDPSASIRGCLARASFIEDNVKDSKRAEEQYKRCLDKVPTDPLGLRLMTKFYDGQARGAEATELWVRAVAKAPENLSFRVSLADRYEASGKVDQARKLLTEGVEKLGTAAAWGTLAEFERRNGHSDKALEAINQATKVQPASAEGLAFLKADVLIDLNKLDEAQALVDQIKEPASRDLLKGRVLLARGQPQAALAAFDSGLRRWPNNAGGRYLAGLAARDVGDYDRAASEFREAIRADSKATDAALMLAYLELSRGNYKDATEFARNFMTNRSGARPEGYDIYIRAATAQGLYDSARRTADSMAKAGFQREAAVSRAGIEAAAQGHEAAARSLQKAGLDLADPANEMVLRALAEQLVAAGKPDEALAPIARALAAHPDAASLYEIQGTVLVNAKRYPEASKSLEKALQLDPSQGRAKTGLAQIAAENGDPKKAIALYDEAAKALPQDVTPAYLAAQLVLASGDRVGAKQRLEEVVRRDPGHAASRNDLAWLLAESNQDLDRALQLAEAAHKIDPRPEVTDTLGWVHLQRGELDLAVASFDEALKARPDSPSVRYHLGIALARQGEHQRAQATLQQALADGPFPEADAARSELAKLEQK